MQKILSKTKILVSSRMALNPMRKPRAINPWFVFLRVNVNLQRVITFVDGFNLYHAIDRLKRHELKWLDLRALSGVFLNSNFEQLTNVLYFSAYASHMGKSAQNRQKAYVKALELTAVKPILGHFKEKDRKCPDCKHKWIGHEEKETDVNIALFLLDSAYQNFFDRALVITNDSDLAPAIQMTRKRFPEKRITTVAPPQLLS
jgi:hypothetical protein